MSGPQDGRRPEFLTIPEAEDSLWANRQRVDDLLSQGGLRRYKDGSRMLVERAQLEAHLVGGRGDRAWLAAGVAPGWDGLSLHARIV